MKYLFTTILVLLLLLIPVRSNAASDLGMFVAVISAQDLSWQWTNYPKYQRDLLFIPQTWWELDRDLDLIATVAGESPILLDLMVHGNDFGLYLSSDSKNHPGQRASFGFVLNHICKRLAGKKVLILVESCYAGNSYKNTVRGATRMSPYDVIEDYPIVPTFPIYGAGAGFSVTGQIMYLQLKHNFRKYWVNLTEYDSLGKNKSLPPEEPETIKVKGEDEIWSKTTADMYQTLKFFRENIP